MTRNSAGGLMFAAATASCARKPSNSSKVVRSCGVEDAGHFVASLEERVGFIDDQRGAGLAKYSCWCPKVMAAIGRLPDTLADRCIVITMQRKMPGEKCDRLRELDAAEYRQRCADFVREHSAVIAAAQPEIPAALNDRAADIWEPLFAVADLAGGEWPALARQAAQKLSGNVNDEMSLVGYLLKDIRTLILNRNADRILSRDILAALNPRHDRAWEDLRRGREINEYWLGHKMSELGIRSKYLRFGQTVARGYILADIEAAFRRYVPSADLHSAPAAAVAKQRGTE